MPVAYAIPRRGGGRHADAPTKRTLLAFGRSRAGAAPCLAAATSRTTAARSFLMISAPKAAYQTSELRLSP
eukprot:5972524-Pyramimonas_sp.AAC.1